MTTEVVAAAAGAVFLAVCGIGFCGWLTVTGIQYRRRTRRPQNRATARQHPLWTEDPTAYYAEFLDITDGLPDVDGLSQQILPLYHTEESQR